MRRGAAISGAMHGVLLGLALWGADWFGDRDPVPLVVTEIELVDGTEFDAVLSTAPVVPSEGPSELAPPAEGDAPPDAAAPPDEAAEPAPAPELATAPAPAARPDAPAVRIPPPPTDVPTEAPAPSIAEIPSPDPLREQAAEPESPPSTEPVQPLASNRPPEPSPRPLPPPEPEPEPEVVEKPAEDRAPDPEASEPDEPEPESQQEPQPEAVAEAEPDAPEGNEVREARLPVAKPADKAAAARAAAAQQEAQRVAEAEREQTEPAPSAPEPAEPQTPRETAADKPATAPAGGSTSRFAVQMTQGETRALALSLREHFPDPGLRDRDLELVIRVQLGRDGTITGKPELIREQGGDAGSRNALFQAARRAMYKAQNAGEFRKLPAEKYDGWRVIDFIVTPKGIRTS